MCSHTPLRKAKILRAKKIYQISGSTSLYKKVWILQNLTQKLSMIMCFVVSAWMIIQSEHGVLGLFAPAFVFLTGMVATEALRSRLTQSSNFKAMVGLSDTNNSPTRWVCGPHSGTEAAGIAFLCCGDMKIKRILSNSLKAQSYRVVECDSFSAIEVLLSSGFSNSLLFIDRTNIAENIFLLSDVQDLRSYGTCCSFIYLLSDDETSVFTQGNDGSFDFILPCPNNLIEAQRIAKCILPKVCGTLGSGLIGFQSQ